VDWLSRPPSDIARVFVGRPVAIIGATSGPGDTRLAHAARRPVLRTLGTAPWWGARVLVSSAAKVFDADGRLTDEAIRSPLEADVRALACEPKNLRDAHVDQIDAVQHIQLSRVEQVHRRGAGGERVGGQAPERLLDHRVRHDVVRGE